MGKWEREKGRKYEGEVATAFKSAGFAVRGLEASGDHLCIDASGRVLHIEAKRHENLRIPSWLRQLRDDTPLSAVGVLVFRQNRGESYVCLSLSHFLDVIK